MYKRDRQETIDGIIGLISMLVLAFIACYFIMKIFG